MNIEQFLQKNAGDRVEHENRWLYWDRFTREWVVRVHHYRAKSSPCLYSGPDLPKALEALGVTP